MSVIAPSRRVLCLFAVAILGSGIAAADTIDAYNVGAGENIYLDVSGAVKQEFAGLIEIKVTNSSGTYYQNTYCVQITVNIDEGTTYNTTVELPSQVNWSSPPPTNAALEQIAWLIDNYQASAISGTDPNDTSAALQLAIWKIAEDGVQTYVTGDTSPFTSGIVEASTTKGETTNATVLSDALGYLADADKQSSNLANVYINTTQATPPVAAQMLEGIRYADTPESSTFILAGVALLTLARMARRKLGSH